MSNQADNQTQTPAQLFMIFFILHSGHELIEFTEKQGFFCRFTHSAGGLCAVSCWAHVTDTEACDFVHYNFHLELKKRRIFAAVQTAKVNEDLTHEWKKVPLGANTKVFGDKFAPWLCRIAIENKIRIEVENALIDDDPDV